MSKKVIIIRQTSERRTISADEAVEALPPEQRALDREQFEVPTADLADAVTQGDWHGHDLYLREHALKIRAAADAASEALLHYFGLADVPHIVSLGAFIGTERAVEYHDHNRDNGAWVWRSSEPTLSVSVSGVDELKTVVKARGPAVVRVSISDTVNEADVHEVVGEETVAEIAVTVSSSTPTFGIVKSASDVHVIRQAFRDAYAVLRANRPNIDVVHLFVAAPPSVCFAIGQELSLLNGPPVLTYRYRRVDGQPPQQPAVKLSAVQPDASSAPLTDDEKKIATIVRNEIWPAALKDVENYAATKKNDGHDKWPWYGSFVPREEIAKARPFPNLPPFSSFVPTGVTVDPEPLLTRDYGFEENTKRWKLNDRLLVGLHRAVDGDRERLRSLIRLFLFHEYLHLFHSVGKHTAEEVGKFSNCLEHIDYTADTYAILHQLDLVRYLDADVTKNFENIKRFIAGQIELAITSFWAFDESLGNEWQVRRIRRYLNWYWRLVQVEDAPNAEALMKLFTRQPKIEIGGLYQVARGRRVLALLDRLDRSTYLELAVVMENEVLYRQSDNPNTNLRELLESFAKGEHEKILYFFRALYSLAKGNHAVQPPADGGH